MPPLASPALIAALIAGALGSAPSAPMLPVHHAPWHLGEADPAPRRRVPEAPQPMFTAHDRAAVRAWQGSNPGWTPPPSPPPAALDRVRPGHPLPAIVPHGSAPASLAARMPKLPGYSYVVVGTSLVMLDRSNNTVVDILWDVFKA